MVTLEVVPGRYTLPVDTRSGAQKPATTAAGLIVGADPAPAARMRCSGAVVDQENTMPGVASYAVPVALPGGRKAALQVTAPAIVPLESRAAPVHRAAAELERRAALLPARFPGAPVS